MHGEKKRKDESVPLPSQSEDQFRRRKQRFVGQRGHLQGVFYPAPLSLSSHDLFVSFAE
jgi:hypothetical protein